MCKKCLITANHDVYMFNYVNGMNSHGKKQKANVSNTENQKKQKPQVKKPKKVGSKERLASPTPSEPSISRRWSPTGRIFDCNGKIIKSSASKGQSNGDNACTSNPHEPSSKRFPNSTSFLGRLSKFFLGTVHYGNDYVAAILGFSDLQWGNILITRVYFVEVLGHNLFSVGQFCDSDLESWLWHQRLSHLNFDTINDLAKNDLVTGLPKFKYHKEHLCPLCEQGKSKKASHPSKPVPNSKQRSKDEAPEERIVKILGSLVLKGDIGFFIVILLVPVLTGFTSKDKENIGVHGMGLDLTYAPSTITTQKPTEGDLDSLFEAMYDDYIGGQPSSAPTDTAPTPTNSSSQATNCPNSSQNVDELETQQHGQHHPVTIADNVPNAMFDANTFVNPFATPSTSDAEPSSSQYVDPSNMHTFYQPYPHE
ncbi:retrovirus-related pol polyprotein from transposon TNT 1-94, partial [Tanacetum coccineum]